MASTDYLTAVLALAFVVGLIALLGWAVRRFGLIPGASAVTRTGRRIKIVEVTPIDVRRKLVLIRRDQAEHLVLLGAQRDLVIETGINAAATTGAAPATESGPAA